MEELGRLETEQENEESRTLHRMSAYEILEAMNREDMKVARTVRGALPEIARAVEQIARP